MVVNFATEPGKIGELLKLVNFLNWWTVELLKPVSFQVKMCIKTDHFVLNWLITFALNTFLSAMIFFKSWVVSILREHQDNVICLFSACTHHSFTYLSSSAWERSYLHKVHRHLILQSMLYVNIKTRLLNSVLRYSGYNSIALAVSSMNAIKIFFLTFSYEQIVDI